jgi:hypothetical protein
MAVHCGCGRNTSGPQCRSSALISTAVAKPALRTTSPSASLIGPIRVLGWRFSGVRATGHRARRRQPYHGPRRGNVPIPAPMHSPGRRLHDRGPADGLLDGILRWPAPSRRLHRTVQGAGGRTERPLDTRGVLEPTAVSRTTQPMPFYDSIVAFERGRTLTRRALVVPPPEGCGTAIRERRCRPSRHRDHHRRRVW